MKKISIVGLMILAILLVGCGNKESDDTLSEADGKSAVAGEVSAQRKNLIKRKIWRYPMTWNLLKKILIQWLKSWGMVQI